MTMKTQIISAIILATILLIGNGLFFWQSGFFENDIDYLEGYRRGYNKGFKECNCLCWPGEAQRLF